MSTETEVANDRIVIDMTVRVTDENLDDMVETAAYGGISYWATQPEPEDFALAEEQGAEWVFKVSDSGAVHTVTRGAMRHAFALLAQPRQEFVGSMIGGYFQNAIREATEEDGIETGHIDSDAADVLVQVACFGKVIYG